MAALSKQSKTNSKLQPYWGNFMREVEDNIFRYSLINHFTSCFNRRSSMHCCSIIEKLNEDIEKLKKVGFISK